MINKVDTLRNKGELLPLIQGYRERFDFKAVIPISALKGEGTGDILGRSLRFCLKGRNITPEITLQISLNAFSSQN